MFSLANFTVRTQYIIHNTLHNFIKYIIGTDSGQQVISRLKVFKRSKVTEI